MWDLFDPLVFGLSLYSIVGAILAAVWVQLIRRTPISVTAWDKIKGFVLYFFAWPLMVGLDMARALKIERKMRAAYRNKGSL